MAFNKYDSVIDSPGNVFATLNPLYKSLDGTPTLTDGNLKATPNIAQYHTATSNIGVSSGKWYCEILCLGTPNSANYFGVGNISELNALSTTQTVIGYSSQGYSISMQDGVYSRKNDTNSLLSTSLGAFGNGDIFNIHMDLDNGNIYFGNNGTYANGGSPVATGLDGTFFIALTMYNNGFSGAVLNTGQDHTFGGYPNSLASSAGFSPTDGSPGRFYYQPPDGAKALCSANLPMPIENPKEYFRAVTYVGNDGTQSITDVGFQPDLIWIKRRDTTGSHVIFDSIRGATNGLNSDENFAQWTDSSILSAFNSNGFLLEGTHPYSNASSENYVAWSWKAGGGGGKYNIDGKPYLTFEETGLTAGDIEPTGMSVNTKAGFSIVKYTGNGTTGAAVPHGLTEAPDLTIIKGLVRDRSWDVQTQGNRLYLDTAVKDQGDLIHNPDSSMIQLADGNNFWNDGDETYIMYCWHSVPGYSKIGSYTGNGSTTSDGPFVYTGFKPAFLMIKNKSTGEWVMVDNARNTYNPVNNILNADATTTEADIGQTNRQIDFLGNGFKIKYTTAGGTTALNATDEDYIYMAFAEKPLATQEQKRWKPKLFNIMSKQSYSWMLPSNWWNGTISDGGKTWDCHNPKNRNYGSVIVDNVFRGDFEVLATWHANHLGMGIVYKPGASLDDFTGVTYSDPVGSYWANVAQSGFADGGGYSGIMNYNFVSNTMTFAYMRIARSSGNVVVQWNTTGWNGSWTTVASGTTSEPAIVGFGQAGDNNIDPLRLVSVTE